MKKMMIILFLIFIIFGCESRRDFVEKKCESTSDCNIFSTCRIWFDITDCSFMGLYCARTNEDVFSNGRIIVISSKEACLKNKQ